jgi:pterin-4a-carbinolamine dehydratase
LTEPRGPTVILTAERSVRLGTRIHPTTFANGLQVVNAIGEAAEEMNHHPDLGLRYSRVDVWLSSATRMA